MTGTYCILRLFRLSSIDKPNINLAILYFKFNGTRFTIRYLIAQIIRSILHICNNRIIRLISNDRSSNLSIAYLALIIRCIRSLQVDHATTSFRKNILRMGLCQVDCPSRYLRRNFFEFTFSKIAAPPDGFLIMMLSYCFCGNVITKAP